MKKVIIKYSNDGLNSRRLILNAIIDVVEDTEFGGYVNVHPEVSLHDVFDWMKTGLVYNVHGSFANLVNLTTNEKNALLCTFITEKVAS